MARPLQFAACQHNTRETATPLMAARGRNAGGGDDVPAAAVARVDPAGQQAEISSATDAAAEQMPAAEPWPGVSTEASDGSTPVKPSAAASTDDAELPTASPVADVQQPAAAHGSQPEPAAQGGQPVTPVQGPLPEPGPSPPEQQPARTAAHAPRPLGNVVIQTDEDAVRELHARQVRMRNDRVLPPAFTTGSS